MNAKKYNKMLNGICNPEIERLRKVEKISYEIIDKIKSMAIVDYNTDECHIINAIQRIISANCELKN